MAAPTITTHTGNAFSRGSGLGARRRRRETSFAAIILEVVVLVGGSAAPAAPCRAGAPRRRLALGSDHDESGGVLVGRHLVIVAS